MSPSLLEYYPLLAAAYAVMLYSIMLTLAFFLAKLSTVSTTITPAQGRYGSLDGLRGVLAAGVFIHHSFTAYSYFNFGEWKWSQSNFLNHLGQTTVALFFMITGFLFALKSISPNIDWKAFYISRFARLFPLYAIIIFIVFIIVFIVSHGILYESEWTIISEFIQWLSFVCFGRPDINALPMTWTLIAGVNWTLKFEIIFYVFGVPILYFLSRYFSLRIMSLLVATLLVGCLILRSFHFGGPEVKCASQFLSGIIIAYAYKAPLLLKLFQSLTFRVIAGASVLLLFFLEGPIGLTTTLMTIILFPAIVGGFSVWGLLNTRAALWLGDISYGIYLIHGLVLWLLFFTLKEYGDLPTVSLLEYGVLMSMVGIIVVALASLSYIKIERPAMAFARTVRH